MSQAPGTDPSTASMVSTASTAPPTPSTAQLADEAMRALRALTDRAEAGQLDALQALGEVHQDLRSNLIYAVVDGLRAQSVPTSWTTIGRALGMSKQAAQQRYGD